jgi:SAM-dependent methyltransferase
VPRIEPFEHHLVRYEAWFERHRHAYLSELRAVEALVPTEGTGVEIGVGTGRFAGPLGIRLGVDPSRAMAVAARRRGVRVIAGVAEALPLPARCVDYAVMITTVCFVDDLRAAFAEAHRVLHPGGALVVGLVDSTSALGQVYERSRSQNVFYEVATFYSATETAEHLMRAGFGDVTSVQTLFHLPTEMLTVDRLEPGWGRGSFVVLRAAKAESGAEYDR